MKKEKFQIFIDSHDESFIERINACIHQNVSETTGNILREFSISEIELVLKYLIEFYKIAPDLLFLFWQKTSDSCPVESDLSEQQEIDFAIFVKTNVQKL